jgi:hypothetical protein
VAKTRAPDAPRQKTNCSIKWAASGMFNTPSSVKTDFCSVFIRTFIEQIKSKKQAKSVVRLKFSPRQQKIISMKTEG